MADDFRASELKSFAKAKATPRPVRVVGGLRGVYLRADRVRVVDGKNINGSRSSSPPSTASTTSPAAPGRDPADPS
jgi:hypothetical protein